MSTGGPPNPGSVPGSAGAARPPPAPVAATRTGDLSDTGTTVRDGVRGRSWTLRGAGKVSGGIELDRLSVVGDLSVAGAVVADQWDGNGRTTVDGPASGAGAWTLSGESRFGDSVRAASLKASGRLDVRKDLEIAQQFTADGSLDVFGTVRAASFQFRGALDVRGEIRAPTVQIEIRGPSKASAIRGRQVVVDRSRSLLRDAPTLDVLEIEAEEVRLSGVVAQLVRAARITIGVGCRIAEIDGTIVGRDPKSQVGPQVRSRVPYGLSR